MAPIDGVRCGAEAGETLGLAGPSGCGSKAAEFDTRTPHWFGATSSGPVEFPSLIGKQGERAHVRTAPTRRNDRES